MVNIINIRSIASCVPHLLRKPFIVVHWRHSRHSPQSSVYRVIHLELTVSGRQTNREGGFQLHL
jgi:hypothetical protein